MYTDSKYEKLETHRRVQIIILKNTRRYFRTTWNRPIQKEINTV